MQAQILNLNLTPGGVPEVAHVSQYDVDRPITCKLWDGSQEYTIPAGADVKINGIKPDKHGFSYSPDDGYISIDSGRQAVLISTALQMTCVNGPVICEIVIEKDDSVIGTINFTMEVEEGPLNDDTIISDTELPAIIAEAEEQAERAEAAAATVADAAEFIREHEEEIEQAPIYAQQAIASAQTATTKAGEAATSATNAATSATSAGTSATNAAASATNAAASELAAGNSATSASTSATTATTKAGEAATSATNAANSATTASTKAGEAADSATSASTSATTATTKAGEASTSATNAAASETAAAGSATAAGNSATAAANSATAAALSKEDSEAYAVGKRNGVDVPSTDPTYHNNSKWWCDQAAQAAGGGVTSFNGRSGAVNPTSGDYTAAMVGALPTQTGSQGQVLGFTATDTVGAMNIPAPSYTGTQGQLLGFTADNTVGAVDAPVSGVSSFNGRTGAITPTSGDYTASMVGALPTQTGSAGQVLGFTAADTVGAKDPTTLFTGASGKYLGFTAANTVGAVDGPAVATTQTAGVVKPDGTSITVDNDGTIHSQSGHEIYTSSGTAVAQKTKMKFMRSTVENSGDTTVVTPDIGGVATRTPTSPQQSGQLPMVTSFNGRSGTVTPASGDYTAAMVGALPTQTGTAGQVLGFTANNTVGAKDPTSLYTGTQGQILGFTATDTVGAVNPSGLYTGTAGQVLGFTGTNTVGAVNMTGDYLGNWSTIQQVFISPTAGETTTDGTRHIYGTWAIPAPSQYDPGGDGLYLWQITGPNYVFTSAAIETLTIQMCTSINTGTPPDYRMIYRDQCVYPAGMGQFTVDGLATGMSAALIMFLKQGTGIKIDFYASPITANGITFNYDMLSVSLYKLT